MTLHPDIAAVLSGDSEGCIVCGDCLEIMADMPDGCVDAVVTDPPYGGVLNKKHGHGKLKESVERYGGGDWDYRPIRETFRHILRVCRNAIIWGGNYFSSSLPDARCWLVWDKINGESSFADCELAWTSLDSAVRKHTQHVSSILDRQHPTQKPVPLMAWCIGLVGGDTIFDPYMGSGTTCVATKKLGRRWIGIDIDEGYCEIARNRLRDTERPLFDGPTTSP